MILTLFKFGAAQKSSISCRNYKHFDNGNFGTQICNKLALQGILSLVYEFFKIIIRDALKKHISV